MGQVDRCRSLMGLVELGDGQDEDRRQSKDAGFDHHMVKPLDYGVLQELLATLDEAKQTTLYSRD